MPKHQTIKRKVYQDDQDQLRKSRFLLKDRQYHRQFFHLYNQRLKALKPRLTRLAQNTWCKSTGPDSKLPRFADKVLDVKGGKLTYLAGTVYANMDNKPSIIDDVKKDLWVVNPPETTSYINKETEFSIEDDSGRMKIYGEALDRTKLVTGVVAALLGRESTSGDFEVQDVLLPGLLDQASVVEGPEPRYIAFVSGLNLGESSQVDASKLQLLEEFLLGGMDFEAIHPNNISHLVIVGNSYKPMSSSNSNGQDPTSRLDSFLNQICQSISVYLVPGSNDPTTLALPQQPLHPGLFKESNGLPTMHRVTNPFDLQLAGLCVMGTAGQPIDDLSRCGSRELSSLEWLEATLQFGHFAPTSPDTLYGYPYTDQDPFVMAACPHIYLAGNQPKFSSRIVVGAQGQRTCLVTIPAYSATHQVVLVEANTLESDVLTLDPCTN